MEGRWGKMIEAVLHRNSRTYSLEESKRIMGGRFMGLLVEKPETPEQKARREREYLKLSERLRKEDK